MAMNTKLTLTLERSVIEKAKSYARKSKLSLSDLIENYLKALTNEDTIKHTELAPTVKLLKGAFTPPQDFDYKKELVERLSEKHLQ